MFRDPLTVPGTLCAWDLSEPTGSARFSRGEHRIALTDGGPEPVERVAATEDRHAARFYTGRWLIAEPQAHSQLNAKHATALTLAVWIRRARKPNGQCEAIAGVWDEQYNRRQYALFLNALNAKDHAVAHVSQHGGNAPGHDHCRSAAVGATTLPFDTWQHLALVWDGHHVAMWINGQLDANGSDNPFAVPGPLFSDPTDEAHFSIGAVSRQRPPIGMGNAFYGDIASVALWHRALTTEELHALATPG